MYRSRKAPAEKCSECNEFFDGNDGDDGNACGERASEWLKEFTTTKTEAGLTVQRLQKESGETLMVRERAKRVSHEEHGEAREAGEALGVREAQNGGRKAW